MVPEGLHQETFAQCLQSDFRVVDLALNEFAIRLVEINDRKRIPHQEVFALLFHGPSENFIQQGMHKLEHSQLGEIDIFLVPVGQDNDGFLYEAVFNRVIS